MNSHMTPTVIEKQNATMVMYIGDKCTSLLLWLSRSTSENPTAAQRNPFMVCSIVSQPGIKT